MSDALKTLLQSVEQEELTQEQEVDLNRRIGDRKAAVQGALEALEQSLVIMVDSIVNAKVDGNSRLRSVLMLQDDLFGGDVRLKHVRATHDFLTAQVSDEEHPSVHKQYVLCVCSLVWVWVLLGWVLLLLVLLVVVVLLLVLSGKLFNQHGHDLTRWHASIILVVLQHRYSKDESIMLIVLQYRHSKALQQNH